MARHVPRRSRAPRSTPPGPSTRSASPTSGRRRSCGTARPASRSGPGSAGRTCARSARASRCAATACGSARTSRRPRCSGCSTSYDPDRGRDLCFGTVDTWVAWTLSSGALHVTDATNAAVTGLRDRRRRSAWDARALDVLGVPRGDAAGDRRLRRRRRRTRPRCPARRRSPRCSATSRRRSSARAACDAGDAKITFGTGGMLDVVLGARRRPRSTHRGRARHVPDRRVAARTAATTWGVEAVMLAAGTNVQWLRDDLGTHRDRADESHDARGVVRRHRRRRVRARAARARHAGVGLRRARHAVRPDARHRPRRGRARGARRHRAPWRRPRRRGRGRQRHHDPDAARRRRHDRQPDVRAGARRRDATPGRDLTGARGDRRSAPRCSRASRSATARRSTTSPGTWTPRARVEPRAPLDRDRWRDAVARSRRWIPELSGIDF